MALEVGYRHLDCAAYYKNEPVVGKGIADWLASEPSKNKREDLFITSKVRAQAAPHSCCAVLCCALLPQLPTLELHPRR